MCGIDEANRTGTDPRAVMIGVGVLWARPAFLESNGAVERVIPFDETV